MQWLLPSVIATTTATCVLTFCYYYIYTKDKQDYLKIWAISWGIYLARYVFLLVMLLWQKSPWLLIGNQITTLVSGVLLLYGSYRFINKKFPVALLLISLLISAWIIYSILLKIPFLYMTLPTFTFLALIYIWTGVLFLKYSANEQKEASVIGVTFILWGIHKGDYPFLRPVVWFAPWGYLIAAALEFITALGLIIVYFRKTRDELEDNRNKLHNIIKKSPLPIVITDENQDIRFYNDKFIDSFGYTIEDISTADQWWETVYPDPDYRQTVQNSWVSAIKEAEIKNVDIGMQEWDITTKDGSRRTCEFYMMPMVDGGLVVMNDITEKKRGEARFKAIFESANDGLIIATLTKQFIHCNKKIRTLLGYSQAELMEMNVHDLHPEETTEKAVELFEKMIKGEITIAKSLPVKRKDNSIFYADINSSLIELDGKNYIMGSFRDVTELFEIERQKSELEKKLIQTQKMESIGTLAGGIAHDFNNILSSIIGFSEMALEQVDKGSVLEDDLQEILTGGLRAKELVKQILTFARQTDVALKPLNIAPVIEEAVRFIRSSTPSDIEINHQIDCTNRIMGNPTQVHQIIMNICTNAAQSIQGAGRINIEATDLLVTTALVEQGKRISPGEYIKIEISDTGPGISAAHQKSIFEPYFTTKQPGEGTGLGLAVVHGIVKVYNGEILVKSNPEEGTRFTIYLPATTNTGIVTENPEKKLPTGSETILFIDDEPSIVKMGTQHLSRLGYTVISATSSSEALNLIKTSSVDIDLVITDMTMPKMTGDQLAKEILSINPGLPIILCTGYSKRINDEAIEELGIKALMIKPVEKPELAGTVRSVLDGVIHDTLS